MERRKIFFGFPIPENVSKRLEEKMHSSISEGLRMTKRRNLHITVLPIGFRTDEDIVRITEAIRTTCASFEPFELSFDRIAPLPESGKGVRHFLWYTGPESEELLLFYNRLREALNIHDAPKKHFAPHITLARIDHEKRRSLQEKSALELSWSVVISVSGLTLFESVFTKEEGLRYEPLETFPFEAV